MELKLFDSERKVMEVLWDHGDLSAKELADRLKELVGWSKTTTYTVIKNCIDKKAVSRSEPGFVCHPLVSREEVREQETDALIDRMYQRYALPLENTQTDPPIILSLYLTKKIFAISLSGRCHVKRRKKLRSGKCFLT